MLMCRRDGWGSCLDNVCQRDRVILPSGHVLSLSLVTVQVGAPRAFPLVRSLCFSQKGAVLTDPFRSLRLTKKTRAKERAEMC